VAKRTLNRRELRQQNDAAEARASETEAEVEEVDDADEGDDEDSPKPKKKAKPKAPAKPRAKKPRAKKAPPRMVARWAVYDGAMKPLAMFPYNQRSAADQKLIDLAAKKTGTYFVQIVKEPMPEAEAADGPVVNA
jgi:hypothetical protein